MERQRQGEIEDRRLSAIDPFRSLAYPQSGHLNSQEPTFNVRSWRASNGITFIAEPTTGGSLAGFSSPPPRRRLHSFARRAIARTGESDSAALAESGRSYPLAT